MEIPALVEQTLGDEDVRAGVSLGDEDAVCLTPTRTIVYHGESILSDESVAEYSHDVECVSVKDGRRKTKFVLEYVDGSRSFTVPSNRGEKVLQVLLEGVLRVAGVIDDDESIAGVYRFSELTLAITDRRLIKHIGQVVWDDDYETYPYADVTGLEFEETSVAMNVSVVVDGRPQRVKVPSEEGPVVRRTLESALFEFYDVASLEEFNRVVDDTDDGGAPDDAPAESTDDLDFGSGIDPLVTSGADEESDPLLGDDGPATPQSDQRTESGRPDAGGPSGRASDGRDDAGGTRESGKRRTDSPDQSGADRPTRDRSPDTTEASSASDTDRGRNAAGSRDTDSDPSAGTTGGDRIDPLGGDREEAPADGRDADTTAGKTRPDATDEGAGVDETAADEWFEGDGPTGQPADDDPTDAGADIAAQLGYEPASQAELEAVSEQLDELTDAVDRQNELLKRQHKAIKQLVAELREQ